jgi:ankyrin repeat protein
MKVLALIVPALLSASVAAYGDTAITHQNITEGQERLFNEKSKIPAFFTAACRDGKDAIVEQFLIVYPDYARDHNTRLPSSGESCLHHAARNGHASIIEMMIGKGSDPNIKASNDEYGIPPLFHAITNGHYAATKILLRNGAEVNQVFESPDGNNKKVTCYDILMDMIDRIGDEEAAILSGDEDYYRMKEQMDDRGAKRYEQLVNEQTDVRTEL